MGESFIWLVGCFLFGGGLLLVCCFSLVWFVVGFAWFWFGFIFLFVFFPGCLCASALLYLPVRVAAAGQGALAGCQGL